MTIKLYDIVKMNEVNEHPLFSRIEVEKVDYYREKNKVVLTLHTPSLLSYQEYRTIHDSITKELHTNLDLYIHSDEEGFVELEFNKYFHHILKNHKKYHIFSQGLIQYTDNTVIFLFGNQNEVNDANDCIEGLLNHFYKFGYHN
ncbi:MAG: hypothetical protein IKE51_03540, partial [Solobacterium sp.]|nr:hypothetical protein [Solobacterium sp.]